MILTAAWLPALPPAPTSIVRKKTMTGWRWITASFVSRTRELADCAASSPTSHVPLDNAPRANSPGVSSGAAFARFVEAAASSSRSTSHASVQTVGEASHEVASAVRCGARASTSAPSASARCRSMLASSFARSSRRSASSASKRLVVSARSATAAVFADSGTRGRSVPPRSAMRAPTTGSSAQVLRMRYAEVLGCSGSRAAPRAAAVWQARLSAIDPSARRRTSRSEQSPSCWRCWRLRASRCSSCCHRRPPSRRRRCRRPSPRRRRRPSPRRYPSLSPSAFAAGARLTLATTSARRRRSSTLPIARRTVLRRTVVARRVAAPLESGSYRSDGCSWRAVRRDSRVRRRRSASALARC
mmetsp:Transcript_30387/g.94082  ORF Transcript_30387/g.94082 Transcript_30387/m.94082 type:complete len:358 (-) Transcript_30387:279-1352(-)